MNPKCKWCDDTGVVPIWDSEFFPISKLSTVRAWLYQNMNEGYLRCVWWREENGTEGVRVFFTHNMCGEFECSCKRAERVLLESAYSLMMV